MQGREKIMFEKKEIEKYIKIYPEKLPYIFEIDGFKFEIYSNSYSGNLYINGYDKNGELLGEGGEKLILDFPLWWVYTIDLNGNRNIRYPNFNLVPRSIDGKNYDINKKTIGNKILLSYEVV